jgi:hypothetical protein
VQINDLVLERAEALWPDMGGLRAISKAKFKRPIRPKETLHLTISRKPQTPEIRYRIEVNEALCSSGILLLSRS